MGWRTIAWVSIYCAAESTAEERKAISGRCRGKFPRWLSPTRGSLFNYCPFLTPLQSPRTPAMSSSSATATGSRSPSPQTPATPESSDSLETIAIRSNLDLSTWYKTLSAPSTNPGVSAYWDEGAPQSVDVGKEEEGVMLSLDDLIQDYPYDE